MLTLNGNPVLELRLTLPLRRRWTGTLEVSADVALVAGKPAVLKWESDASRDIAIGHVVRSSERAGSVRVDIAGGSGGLSLTLPPAHARVAPLRTPLATILGSASEVLDTSSTKSVLDAQLPFWSSTLSSGAVQLESLVASQVNANWRCLANGKVWVGEETWPEVEDFEAQELDEDGAAGWVLFAPEDPRLVPGVTWRDRQIRRVEHSFTRSDPLRTTVWI